MTCPLVLEHPFSINTNNAAVINMYGNNHYNAFSFSASSNDDDNDRTTWATDKIRRMGYYHVLEQTHVVLPTTHSDNNLEALLQCINEALRALGCHVASYDANSCGATVQAVGGVEFQVVVWQKQQQLVVELQRLAGNAYTFQVGYAKRVLEDVVRQGFLHGGASPQPHHHRMAADNHHHHHQNNKYTTTIAHAMDTLHKQAIVDSNHHDSNDVVVTETLEFVRRCLFDEASNNTQQVQLGLETLVDVTNPTLAGYGIAQAATTVIRASSVWTEALTELVHMHQKGHQLHLALLAWQGLHALQRNHHHAITMMEGAAAQ